MKWLVKCGIREWGTPENTIKQKKIKEGLEFGE